MNDISYYIELKFHEVLEYKISIQDFEQWVYETKALEEELPEHIYTNLLSLNYKDKYAHNELEKIIHPFVYNAKFEIQRISGYLTSIIDRNEKCSESIKMTYDLYCAGYNFLQKLGMKYGILVSCSPSDNYDMAWDDLPKADQNAMLNEIYPNIITDAQNALTWIQKRKIVLKNTINASGNYEYDDLRNQKEIQQGEMKC